ncbi:hypothetical protein GWN42_32750 [candidate division KSB1 bacterium]|nr:hypothetical protein [candidate division KSB1 bacterium]NIS23990.1 hypothetical protein [candidate division KSB1 bacterium]NIU24640.1 hypothetical protein [candidate division KSB1 bacterium]NIU89430.1 hypothetical protein [candidate division KSB1 bacterium]NIV97437.1 hypothetical protein [candidate division KSB1 bacterium]
MSLVLGTFAVIFGLLGWAWYEGSKNPPELDFSEPEHLFNVVVTTITGQTAASPVVVSVPTCTPKDVHVSEVKRTIARSIQKHGIACENAYIPGRQIALIQFS